LVSFSCANLHAARTHCSPSRAKRAACTFRQGFEYGSPQLQISIGNVYAGGHLPHPVGQRLDRALGHVTGFQLGHEAATRISPRDFTPGKMLHTIGSTFNKPVMRR